jgi:hypothetical protein
MNPESVPVKAAYEPPALDRLGSLEELTKEGYESSFWRWHRPWHHPSPPDCFS